MDDQFHMFWGGPFSQWYPSIFEVDGEEYNCTEQYMMAKKAMLFGDAEKLAQIMDSSDPRVQKQMGRMVSGFDEDQWNAVARDVVVRGNLAKFSQNPDLQAYLFGTGDQEIVEASPEDVIWGIGLAADHPDAQDKSKWQGTNWLGIAIMDVRAALRGYR